LLQEGAKSIINYENANRDWTNTSALYASPKLKVLYSEGAEGAKETANDAATQALTGGIPVLPAMVHPDTGELMPIIDIKGWEVGGTQDMFRVFGELKQQESADLSLLVLGSTMLGVSSRNAYSEWLVRMGFRQFQGNVRSDITGFFEWLNRDDVKMKLALISGYPELIYCDFKFNTSETIDTIDLQAFTDFMSKNGMQPTDDFAMKIGLSPGDYTLKPEDNGPIGGVNSERQPTET
jgi:hypothetical protein